MSNRSRRLAGVALAALALSLGGCKAAVWLAAMIAPPPKVKPLYEPPKDKRVLVLVDDLRQPVSYVEIKRMLSESVGKELVKNKLARDTVPYENYMRYISGRNDADRLGVANIGRSLNADLVLVVEITEFRLKDDPAVPIWHGKLATSVRWVDPNQTKESDARLWPRDTLSGHPVEPSTTPMGQENSLLEGTAVAQRLADLMGDEIAKLFYEHDGKHPADQDG